MATVKAVKSTALTSLKDNWMKSCIAAMLPISVIIVLVLTYQLLLVPLGNLGAGIVIGIFSFLLILPLWLGTLRFFWRMANSADDSVDEIFYYFSDKKAFFCVFEFDLRLTLRIFLVGILVFLPSIIVLLITSNAFFEFIGVSMPHFLFNLRYMVYLFAPAAVFYMTYYVLKLYLVSFLFISDEEMKPKECIKRGIEIGKYTRITFFSHIWGFMGWIVFSLLAVTLIFTLPYLMMSYIVECRYNIAYYNLSGKSSAEPPALEI